MEAIRALADEIGPRPACSSAERRATEWCAARLSELGLEVTTEEFHSRTSLAPWNASYFAGTLLAAFLVIPLPLVAALLGAASLVLYARDADGRSMIRPRGPLSSNVIAKARVNRDPQVVVVAHVDTPRASPIFNPRFVGSLRMSVTLLHGVLVLVPLLGGVAWIAEAGRELPSSLWIVTGVLATYLVLAIANLMIGRSGETAGANDNASGVEVLLRLARLDWGGKVWFVVTGSEEVGMLGVQDFFERHAVEVAGARFLNLDSVGAGSLVAVSEEGVLRERRSNRYMLDLAEEVGAEGRPFRGFPTDGTALLARRAQALTLLAVGEDEVPPNWHWSSDVTANVDPAALDRATAVARHVVEGAVLMEVRR
jgi:Peptidase family M28